MVMIIKVNTKGLFARSRHLFAFMTTNQKARAYSTLLNVVPVN